METAREPLLHECNEPEELMSTCRKREEKLANEDLEKLDKGHMQYGCAHYRRRCRIRAPCCNEIFDCRHCHNDAKNAMDVNPQERHDIPRHDVQQVICSLCGTEQDVQHVCVNCGVCMGKYFCSSCKFFDDEISKQQYHCDQCGLCRIGGCDNFFHCSRCDFLVQCAPSLSVTCQKCGSDLMKRLQQRQCLNLIRIRWFGFCAMIAVPFLKSIFTLLLRSV